MEDRQVPREKKPSLRAQGKVPRPDYVIQPAAGSLIGDIPSLRDDPERANAVVAHMIEKHGARRHSGSFSR